MMLTSPKPQHPIAHVEVGFPGVEWVAGVYLDGEKQEAVVCASEVGGYVIRIERTPDGDFRQNVYGEEGWVYEKVYGEVRIELRDEPCPHTLEAMEWRRRRASSAREEA